MSGYIQSSYKHIPLRRLLSIRENSYQSEVKGEYLPERIDEEISNRQNALMERDAAEMDALAFDHEKAQLAELVSVLKRSGILFLSENTLRTITGELAPHISEYV